MPKLIDTRSVVSDALKMAELSHKALTDSVRALNDHDVELARSVIDHDAEIDRLESALDRKCLDLLGERLEGKQLRTVAATYRLIVDLERIGDYSVSISQVCIAVANKPISGMVMEITRMANTAATMLKQCMEAYSGKSKANLDNIYSEDREIDRLYGEVFYNGLEAIVHEPETSTNIVYMIVAARALERIGDHITDIAERIEYIDTGRLVERSVPMHVPADMRDILWE